MNSCGTQIEEVDDKKPSKDEKVSAVKTVDEETFPEKEAEKLATPDEKPKKRRSIGEKKPKKADEPEKIEPSIDEPDHVQVDTVNENDLKPSSKPTSRRGSKKEPSPEPKTIEVYTALAAKSKWHSGAFCINRSCFARSFGRLKFLETKTHTQKYSQFGSNSNSLTHSKFANLIENCMYNNVLILCFMSEQQTHFLGSC